MKKLDAHVLTEEQKQLIEDNLPFCYYWFSRHNVYSEDAQQSMLLKLCDHIHMYDSAKGAITTFIGVVFQSKLIADYKAEHADKRIANKLALYLDDPLYQNEDGEDFTIQDAIEVMEKGYDQLEAQMIVANICKNIKKDFAITRTDVELFLTWVETRNYTFCSKLYNIPKSKVEFKIKQLYRIIRAHNLGDTNIDAQYQRFTLEDIKKRFFAINRDAAAEEQAVVVLTPEAAGTKSRSGRSFVISSNCSYFDLNDVHGKLAGTKLSEKRSKNQKSYFLDHFIKNDYKDVEYCYLVS